ncbi:hypothetical protein V1477_012312 [Vespula maculifrons]|uniref:Uncharacterized protein n=2 Tax=Vespula TaxID=7451 RepID=A0A834JMZ8_VESGE|nr:hypothetical protein HZH68_011959 [Vespula germanica]
MLGTYRFQLHPTAKLQFLLAIRTDIDESGMELQIEPARTPHIDRRKDSIHLPGEDTHYVSLDKCTYSDLTPLLSSFYGMIMESIIAETGWQSVPRRVIH